MTKIVNFLILLMTLTYAPFVYASDFNFQIVVHPSNSITDIDRKALSEIFLKKKNFWQSGRSIVVVDLMPVSLVRRAFSENVLSRPVSAIRNYWQQVLFSGRGVPPAELKSDQEVINFVSEREGAIGYVSLAADTGNVKVIMVK